MRSRGVRVLLRLQPINVTVHRAASVLKVDFLRGRGQVVDGLARRVGDAVEGLLGLRQQVVGGQRDFLHLK